MKQLLKYPKVFNYGVDCLIILFLKNSRIKSVVILLVLYSCSDCALGTSGFSDNNCPLGGSNAQTETADVENLWWWRERWSYENIIIKNFHKKIIFHSCTRLQRQTPGRPVGNHGSLSLQWTPPGSMSASYTETAALFLGATSALMYSLWINVDTTQTQSCIKTAAIINTVCSAQKRLIQSS